MLSWSRVPRAVPGPALSRRLISSVASPSPLPERVSPQALKERQPKPDSWKDSRVTYRGGLYRSKGRSFFGLIMGRWRGTTIDLNHGARRISGARFRTRLQAACLARTRCAHGI
jgi:hypothetical protein